MSNIAPHSLKSFKPEKNLLRRDIVFKEPGAHVKIKWTKTLQDQRSHHWIQLPKLSRQVICPVLALYDLLNSRQLPPDQPLFVHKIPPHRLVIDTSIRDTLRHIIQTLHWEGKGLSFHSFRRSGSTLAYDLQVPLENIMHHGLWRSSAIWTYLQQTSAVSRVAATFREHIS